MVMIKLVRKEDAKDATNYFMFTKLVNIVSNVLGRYQSDNIVTIEFSIQRKAAQIQLFEYIRI